MSRAPFSIITPLLLSVLSLGPAEAQGGRATGADLEHERSAAEAQLHQTFTNLVFEDFGPSPLKGPIYQAVTGGRILYYAPDSGHILFAQIFDSNGVNLTALAQGEHARKGLAAINPAKALAIGPAGAPTVIEFTDPDCPYCRALDRFWAVKATEGKPVRRLIYFVSGIHPAAAGKAEHILCSPDPSAAFKAIYDGAEPKQLVTCPAGKAKVAEDAELVRRIGVSGTPTVIVGDKILAGFQQAELQAFIDASTKAPPKTGP